MEVLESITRYAEKVKRTPYLYENQRQALEMLYEYCNKTDPGLNLKEVDSGFFDEFLMCWLPKNESRLKEREIYQVLKGVGGYCAYLQEIYELPSLEAYEVMKEYKKEYLRIYQLKHLFLRYLGDPIINTNPFVVDFNAYKTYKTRKCTKEKQGVYQQGLFEVMEIDYDDTVIFRKLPKGKFVRVIMPEYIASYMKKGDILHLKIKQKQFFSCWEIDDFKNCYLANASQYLIN